MPLTTDQAERIAARLYCRRAIANRLNGEFDDNFLLTVDGQPDSVLKISHPAERREIVEAQAEALNRVNRACDAAFDFPRLIPSIAGNPIETIATEPSGEPRLVRLLTIVPGSPLATSLPCRPAVLESLGALLANVDQALLGFDHPATRRGIAGNGSSFRWALADSLWVRAALDQVSDGHRRALVSKVLDRVEREALPLLPALRHSVVHGDASEHNVLVDEGRVTGLIDFGDLHHGPTVGELAVAAVYAMFGAGDPLGAASWLVAGYHAIRPLDFPERMALFPLILARVAVSLVNSAERHAGQPNDPYLIVSQAPGWRLLEQLAEVPGAIAETTLMSRVDRPSNEASTEEIRERRRRALGPSLSLSYRRPLRLVRGWKQYLYDDQGNEYLDAYNNVAHVGHAHPHVVDAIARQAALLNTNTRYLHQAIVRYADRLTRVLPPELSVCYFVNSGSEANELALRMARAHTRQRDLIVTASAYHGNTQTLIDVSPYKHRGPGGEGPPDWVHEVPIPDTYRGPYRRDDPEAGPKYAAFVTAVIERIRASGRGLAAFLFESLPSVGGQIVPPPGYLPAAYRAVRAAGGVSIADEVQVGFGRLGSHFWGFETQGVTPDIVVCGKPIGNGHPLGAVITRPEIAESFATGMEYFNTFGGNPVSMAAGIAVLEVLENEGLQAHALAVGNQLLEGLRPFSDRHSLVGDVRGAGLFLGVELVRDRETLEPAADEAAAVVNALRDRGILTGTDGPHHNVVKIRPPMPFSADNASRLIEVLDQVVASAQ